MTKTDTSSVAGTLLILFMLVSSTVIIPLTSAQSSPDTGVNNSTTTPRDNGSHWVGPATDRPGLDTGTTNGTESGAGGSESGGNGGGWLSGGFGVSMPSTKDVTKTAVNYLFKNWFADQLTKLFKNLVRIFTSFIAGTMYPKNNGALGIFGVPERGTNWGSWFYNIYVPLVMPLSVLFVFIFYFFRMTQGIYHGFVTDWPSPGEVLRTSVAVMCLVLVWWQLGSLILHVNHALAMEIAPSGQDFMENMNGLVKATSGAVLMIVLTKGLAASEMAGLVMIYAVRHALIVLYMLTMPLILVSAFLFPVYRARAFFGKLAWHFGTLLLTVYPTVFLLKVGFESEMDFGFSALGDMLVGLGFLLAAIFAILVMGWTSVAVHRMTSRSVRNLAPDKSKNSTDAPDSASSDGRIKGTVKDRLRKGRAKIRVMRGNHPRPTALGSTDGNTDRATKSAASRPLNAMRGKQPNKSTDEKSTAGSYSPAHKSSAPSVSTPEPATSNSRTPISTRATRARADGGRTQRSWGYTAVSNRAHSKD